MKQIIFDPLIFSLILVVTAIYVFVLFHFSNKNKELSSNLEKIFIIIFILSITGITIFPFHKFNPKNLYIVSTSFGTIALELGFYFVTTFVLLSRVRDNLKNWLGTLGITIRNNPALSCFILLVFLSACWSQTPVFTFRSSCVLLATTGVCFYIGKSYDWAQISSLLRMAYGFIAILSLFLHNQSDKGWSGVLSHPIYLGTLMALNIALWYDYAERNPKYRPVGIGIAALSLVVMKFANSTGGYCTFLVLISLLFLMRFIRKLEFKWAFIAILAFLMVSIFVTTFIMENYVQILASFGKDATLTGRTDIWAIVIEKIKQHPLLGYGYQGFWQPWRGDANPADGMIIVKTGYKPPHPHNGFLELGLDFGLVGLILFFLSLLTTLSQAVFYMSISEKAESVIPIVLLMYCVMANISDTQLLEPNHIWLYYILAVVRLSIDLKEQNTRSHHQYQESFNYSQTIPRTR